MPNLLATGMVQQGVNNSFGDDSNPERVEQTERSQAQPAKSQVFGTTLGFELIFTRRYAMAHRLMACNSVKCATPHGHNEFVTVRLAPQPLVRLDLKANMVEEFSKAKKLWHQWVDDRVDHAFQLGDRDPLIEYFQEKEPEKLQTILITPGDPTTEMLAVCFMSKISKILESQGSMLQCIEIEIEETPTNSVRFSGDPERQLPQGNLWFRRSDSTINDF